MLYINKETGELLTYNQMLKQFEEEYDGNDQTNCIDYDEYYEEVQ